jgi:signal transduction histidine kinase
LAIARQVIDQHKGRIEVVSTPGQGSIFTIWLNIWKAETAGSDQVTRPTMPRPELG